VIASPGGAARAEADLDSIDAHIKGNFINGKLAPFVFINCIVRYKGDALEIKEVRLVNSVVRLQVPTVPSPQGITAMRQLTTAADINNVRIPIT
jgi:hypothetical protein